MRKINLDKKQIIISVVSLMIIFILIIFVYRPWALKIRSVSKELEVIEQRLMAGRNIIKARGDLEKKGHLLTRKEISLAIDEITRVGRALNINFISISPQEIESLETSLYQRLPIYMDLESKYRNVGIFLGALEKLEKSTVTIRSFRIDRQEKILPLVKSRLLVDMYLESGDSSGEK